MTHSERERLVGRISSGCLRCRLSDGDGQVVTLLIGRPTRDQRYAAEEIYFEAYQDAISEGAYTEEGVYDLLLEQGMWDDDREERYKKLPKEIEEFKVGLYRSSFKENERKVIRKALGVAKSKLVELSIERSTYSQLTCAAAAANAKTRFLVGSSLKATNGRPCFSDETFWETSNDLLDQAVGFYASSRIDESSLRELARTDPWRPYWTCRKSEASLFGIPSCEYSDEQLRLVQWTSLYDSVYESGEVSDETTEDDDLLDGWLIIKRREREKGREKTVDDLIGNEKIRNSGEVYLPADTAADAAKIDKFNSEQAASIKRARWKHLRENGEVDEADLPDQKQKLQIQFNQLYAQKMGNNQG